MLKHEVGGSLRCAEPHPPLPPHREPIDRCGGFLARVSWVGTADTCV